MRNVKYNLTFMKYYIMTNGKKLDMIDCYFKDFLFATITNSTNGVYFIRSKYIKDEVDKNGNSIYNKRSKDLEQLKSYCNEKFNEWINK